MELTQEQIKKFWSMMSGGDSGSGRKPEAIVHSEDQIPRAGNVSKWYEERGYEREAPIPGTSKRWVNPAAPSVNDAGTDSVSALVGAAVGSVGSAVQRASGNAARPVLPKLSDITSLQQWQTSYGSLDAYNKYAKENGWEAATGAQIEEKLRQLQGVGSKQAVPQPEDLTHKPFGDEAEIIAQGRDRAGYLQKKAAEFESRQKALQEASRLVEENLNQEKSNFDSKQIEDQESLWFLRLAQDDPIAQTYDSYFDYMEAVRNGTVQEKYLPPDIQEHLDTYTRYVEESDNLASVEKSYSQIQQELALSEDLREIYSLSPEDMDAFIKVYDAQATNSGGAGPEWQRMMELFGYDKWWKLTSSYSQYMGLLKEQHRQEQKEKDMRDPVNVVLSNLYAPGLSLVSTLYTPIASIGQMTTNNPVYAEDERYGIKTNTGIYDMQREVQDTRSGTRKLIEGEDPNAGRKFAGMLYGGISSAVDDAARIGAGVVTGINPLGIMAVGSFSSSYEDAANRGANGLQAALYATASAALEVATEKIPLERLLSGTDADTVGKIIADILVKQPGLEIVGEEASYFGGMIADALIMGDKSENNQKLAAYMMAGYTKEQAQQLLTKDILYGAAQIAAETYISSAAMTGASYIGGAKRNGQAEAKAQDDGLNQILQQAAETPASQTVEAVKQASQQAQQQEAATQNTQQQAQEPQPVIQPQQNRPMQEQRQASESENPASRFVEEEATRQEPPVQPVRQEPAAQPVEAVPPQPEAVPIQNQQEQKSPLDIAMEATVRGEDVQPGRPVPNGSADDLENGSVGAAQRGFDPFSELQFEYGNIPSGENPVRPDDMPISTDGENRVSYAARTVKGASVTPDEFSDLIDREVVNGGLTFIPITNDETVQNAVSYISRVGWDEARIRWEADVRAGRAGADTTAIGALLLNNAANAGDRTTWLNILSDYQLLATNTARGLQAMRILKTLQPEDRLYMIRRSVQQMAEDMHLGFDLQIDENLATAYQNAQTDAEADEILGQIQQSIADQIPPTFMEQFTALRYLNMLGNFKTQVRNLAGNVGMKTAKEIKDKVAATIEWIAWKASGETFERTKVFKVRHDLFQAAKADFTNVEHQVQSGGRFDDARAGRTEFAQGVQDRRRIFRTAPMEFYRRATNWAMDAGDVIFSRNAYAKALAGYLQAHGIENFTDASNQLMDNARAYAIREAQEATFRDTNTLSAWVSRIGRRRDTPAFARTLSEGIMPFRKTPANVLVRAEEYSPLGLINATVTSIRAARPGSEITGADVVNSWSKALTGTGMFLFGMLLRNLGLISLGPDDDEKQAAFDKLKGKQDYSLTIPGLPNITLDWLSPVSIPLLMGGELEDMRKEGGIELKDLEKSMTSLSDPLIQMSMLQGVDDTISGIKFSGNNLGQLVLNSSLSYLTQGLTNTFLGQLERSTEDVRMTTYVDENSSLPNWMQRELGRASAKIPGLDFQQIPYINEWGQQEKSIENPLLRTVYNTLSPAYISFETNDPVNDELQRIADSRGTEGIFPKTADKSITIGGEKINLNAQQYIDRATTQGQAAHSILDQAFKSEAYQGLSDDGKAKLVSDVYSYANELGKMKALPDRYTNMSAQWMEELGGDTSEKAVETILKRAQVYDVGAPSDTRYDAAVGAGFTTEQMRDTFSKVSASLSSIDGEKTDYDAYRAVLSATQGDERYKWLEVYGLSDSRLEAMREAVGNGYTETQFIDALETASMFASAQSATSKAWSDGKELPTDKWEEAYNAYHNAPDKLQRLISSQLSTKFNAYLELRNAGMDTKTFLLEVKKYSDIGEEDGELNDATRWHKALDDDVASGLITTTQRNILLANMRYFVQIPQNADKYEELKDSGLDPDSAEYIMTLTAGLLPEYGRKTVSDVQIWEQIISSDLSGPEKTSALEGYMDDKQERKLAYAVSLGFTPSEYVDMYRVYKDTDEYGKGKKEFRIQEFMRELDVDRDLAEALLEIYDGVYGK